MIKDMQLFFPKRTLKDESLRYKHNALILYLSNSHVKILIYRQQKLELRERLI